LALDASVAVSAQACVRIDGVCAGASVLTRNRLTLVVVCTQWTLSI